MNGAVKTRLLRDEQGFTLTEMMVTMLIMIMVLFALYGIFDMSIRVFAFGNDKIEASENARLGLEKMEREIRAAYPVDRITNKKHVFFSAGASATPARPGTSSITFGNDLPNGATPPNRMVDVTEEITYELRSSDNLNNACPTLGTGGVCSLVRRQSSTAAFQPVVEHVVPNGLSFEYFKSDMASTDPAGNGTDIGVVRIKLRVSVDGRQQTLTTDVDLRNRG
ncbi:MAG: prepilin-type N-terminal cleavage/methylation domain-containing protein [Rubrobacteraceae bacterium]